MEGDSVTTLANGILILDYGSQYTQLIARRVRESHVYCEIHPPPDSHDEITRHSPKGIILSGGPNSVYEEGAPGLDRGAMEQVLYDHLGIRKVIWFDSEIAGDDTSGHVDDFVRFVAPGRVVLCEAANSGDPNRVALSRAREALSRSG